MEVGMSEVMVQKMPQKALIVVASEKEEQEQKAPWPKPENRPEMCRIPGWRNAGTFST